MAKPHLVARQNRTISTFGWCMSGYIIKVLLNNKKSCIRREIAIIKHCAANDAGIQGYYSKRFFDDGTFEEDTIYHEQSHQPHSMLCTVKDVALGTLFMGNLTLAPSIFMYAHT